jgi:acyl transferase domain-containing protein
VFAAEGAPSVALGAGKSSLGHLEAAAGIAGVLRALFVLEHQLVPPQVGLGQLTRAVAWDDLPFTIARTLSEPAAPIRFAGVSSFGMSGTNAHVILERAPLRDESSARDAAGPHILALSGHSVAALDAMLQDHAQVLATLPEHDFASFCAASQRVRASLRHRVAITAATPSEAHAAVCALRAGGAHPAAVRGDASLARSSSVAFMFTGQGSQWPAMARALYDAEPVFRSAIDRAGEIVDPLLPLPLGTLLLEECEPEILRATSCAQPALFTTAWALCQLWKSWGVEPDIVLGHSLGEYAAACVAGYFDFEAGLRLVARRAQLMQALPAHGAMLSVRLPAATLALRLRSYAGALEIAAINARNVTVVAGDEAAIGSLAKELGREGLGCKPLEVSHAFHCHHVDVVLPELAAAVRGVTFREPRAELISNLTGDFVELEQFASPEYFCKHTRATVQFAQAVSRLADAHVSAVVEIGPQPVLTGLARQSLPNAELVWLPSMQRGTDAVTLLRRSLAALHVRGVPTRLSATSEVTRHVSLPRYPFQRRTIRVTKAEPAPRLGEDASLRRLCLPHSREAHFELFVAQDDSVVREHRVFGQVVIPAAWHLAALASAAHSLAPSETITLREVSFVLAARVPPEGLVVHMAFLPGSDGELRFRLLSRASSADAHADASWRTHVSGIVSRDAAESRNKLITRDAIADGGRLEPTHFYDDLALRGFDLGPSFRWLEDLRADSALVLASLREPSHGAHSELAIHPGLLDTSFQLLSQLWPAQAHEQAFIPFRIARFELAHAASASPLNARAWRDEPALQPEAAMSAPAHVLLTRADGSRVMLAQGFVFRQVQRESLDAHGGTSVPAPAAPVASHATLLRELAPAQQRARLEEAVRAVIAQVLELVEPEHIAPRDRFFDLGFDSMRAVDAGEALEERLGLPLELTVFFDYPTLEALVDHLTEQLGGRPAEHHVRPGAAWLEPALSSLSEEEAEQLLLKQLERLS